MELVTAFCPLTTADTGETVVHNAGETRFVVDCRVNGNPVALVGQDKITFAAKGVMVSGGGEGNVRLNTVPLLELPPYSVVP